MTGPAAMTKRHHVIVNLSLLTLIVLSAFAPLIAALAAGAFANASGCALDEGGVHPCVVSGHDLGDLLYQAGTLGWLALLTIPVGAIVLLVYAVLAVVFYMWRANRRRGGGRPAA